MQRQTMLGAIVVVYLLVIFSSACSAQFIVPDVSVEAFTPQGFRVSIPAIAGIQLVGFQININKKLTRVEPGEYSLDLNKPENNVWAYDNSDVALKIGDTIHYRIHVQHEGLGYRIDNRQFEVTELLKRSDGVCDKTESLVHGRTNICGDQLILNELFKDTQLNPKTWTTEHYIPTLGPDFEFVSYQKNLEVCYLSHNNQEHSLFIKPKVILNDNEITGELDLRRGCTKSNDNECYMVSQSVFILPPVTSARLVSKMKFRYVKIEIKAKLPAGDWIYPEMYLEFEKNPQKRIWIAYARGNNKLTGNENDDLGGRLLFGGPVLSATEPRRSQHLQNKRATTPFTQDKHIYTLIWRPNEIEVLVDDLSYVKIEKPEMDQLGLGNNDYARLVLGVGVGGINDFPDGYRSSNKQKPWTNKDRSQVKKFFMARNEWLDTWNGDNAALQVDYVKIYAL